MIRKANYSDLSAISTLCEVAQKMHATEAPHMFKMAPDKEGFRAWYKEAVEGAGCYIIVVEELDKIVGYLYAKEKTIEESWVTRGLCSFYLEHIVIDPDSRRKGYGKILMKSFIDEAQRRGVEHTELDVWHFNETARTFFAAYGFKSGSIRMGRKMM